MRADETRAGRLLNWAGDHAVAFVALLAFASALLAAVMTIVLYTLDRSGVLT